jgi:uncharacterized protein (TIGR02391 family)
MINASFSTLLHPRITKHCEQLFNDGHYKHAALEAMTQVEIAIKEKSQVRDSYGVNLVTSLFGEGKSVKLRVPFGEEMQKHAETLFRGAFAYYRNYCAHDGANIDDKTCLRVLALASELLDLVGASELSFADVGGVSGLIKAGVFPNAEKLHNLLSALDGFTLIDDDPDWLEDYKINFGYTTEQVRALIDTGLIEYTSRTYVVPPELENVRNTLPDTVGWFKLTPLGEDILAQEGKREIASDEM